MGTLGFDFTPPKLTDGTVHGRFFKENSTVKVTLAASEPLKAAPIVELAAAQDGERIAGLTADEAGTTFTLTATKALPSSQVDGLYVRVHLEDRAGNKATQFIQKNLEGTASLTNERPVFFDFTNPVIKTAELDPAYVRLGGAGVSVTFTVDEPIEPVAPSAPGALDGMPLVWLERSDGTNTVKLPLRRDGQGTASTFAYTYQPKATDTEGEYALKLKVVDRAGNEGSYDGTATTLLDFTAPALDGPVDVQQAGTGGNKTVTVTFKVTDASDVDDTIDPATQKPALSAGLGAQRQRHHRLRHFHADWRHLRLHRQRRHHQRRLALLLHHHRPRRQGRQRQQRLSQERGDRHHCPRPLQRANHAAGARLRGPPKRQGPRPGLGERSTEDPGHAALAQGGPPHRPHEVRHPRLRGQPGLRQGQLRLRGHRHLGHRQRVLRAAALGRLRHG